MHEFQHGLYDLCFIRPSSSDLEEVNMKNCKEKIMNHDLPTSAIRLKAFLLLSNEKI